MARAENPLPFTPDQLKTFLDTVYNFVTHKGKAPPDFTQPCNVIDCGRCPHSGDPHPDCSSCSFPASALGKRPPHHWQKQRTIETYPDLLKASIGLYIDPHTDPTYSGEGWVVVAIVAGIVSFRFNSRS